jgi:HSP20 family protein
VHHGVTIHHTERQYGKVKRTLRLPSNADANNARAKFNNGVLDLTMPKIEGTSIKVDIEH